MFNLVQALRIEEYPQMAFVGGGGKSSTLFRLVRDYARPALLSTSTHLGKEQSGLADRHLVLEAGEAVGELEISEPSGSLLITGPLQSDGRWTSPGDRTLAELSDLAREAELPFLVEADGSRGLPLKAPAEHEPAIPDFVDQVVVVAGMSGLGESLSTERVHRHEIFAQLAEMQLGETIDMGHLERVLTDARGGLKNIPLRSRKVALFNQAETAVEISQVKKASSGLLAHFDAVLAGAMHSKEAPIAGRYEGIGGVLLAAGGSERFGEPKQLLDWKGQPFIRRVAQAMQVSQLQDCLVVLGAGAEQIAPAIEDLGLRIVINSKWAEGQASSVKAGLAALPEHIGAAMFLQVDRPQISVSLIDALINEHGHSDAAVIAPQIDGQRGTPVLFDRGIFGDMASLEGDQGGRQLFSRHRVNWIPWLDSVQVIDVDTPEDYARLLNYAD